jgi:hypothetical protein
VDARPASCVDLKLVCGGTRSTGYRQIWYSASSSLDLVGFFDTDFVGCGIDRKCTCGTCYFHGSYLVCWSSRKQYLVAQSPTEVMYVATAPKSYGLCTP